MLYLHECDNKGTHQGGSRTSEEDNDLGLESYERIIKGTIGSVTRKECEQSKDPLWVGKAFWIQGHMRNACKDIPVACLDKHSMVLGPKIATWWWDVQQCSDRA
jgi:hypothetical protein